MSDVIEDLSYEDKFLSKLIFEGLLYLLDNSLLCDVELIVEGQTIKAHKSVLAAASLYFRVMFCAGLKETGQREITIHDVSYEAMKSVIHFFYTSCITLKEENIFEIMNVADLLGVTSLHSACNAFLRRAITVHNCVSVYIMCKLHGYSDVVHEAVRHACRNFSRLMEIEEFLDMPFDMLVCCLEKKIVNVYSENGLLNKLCDWVRHDVESRGSHLLILLDQLNIYTLDLGQAECALNQLPTLRGESSKWMDRMRHIRDRGVTLSSRNRQRFNKENKVVLSCGGLSGGAIASVEALATGDTMWRCMVPAPSQPHGFRVVPPLKVSRIYAATTYTDDHVFIIGGRNDSGSIASIERYCVEANEWDEFVPLPEPLEGAAATTINGSLYVSGGFNSTSGITKKAWVLEAGQRLWRSLPPMNQSRSHHGLLAVNGYLYAVAGADFDGMVQSSVERISTHAQEWQLITSLQQPRSHFGAVVFDSFIYILGGLNANGEPLRSVQVYDTLKQEWADSTPLSVGRHSHGATVASGRVYVAAGSDGVHQLASCEQFNPHTRLWHCQPSLSRARVGQSMATITLPVSPPPNI